MSTDTTVTLADVHRVAQLANLELTPEEAPRMAHDLNAILGHVAQLAELDTTGIEPMAQVASILAEDALGLPDTGHGDALRPDQLRPSIDRKAVMASAPETDGRFFKVPKVIER